VGGSVTYAQELARGLESQGIEVVIDFAGDWIPEKTGWMVDRKVSGQLRDAGKGFDLVVAWGYRSAWACSEAFYLKKPWVYVAYDTPKTVHDQLIGRLGAARTGICCSRTTMKILDKADAVNLEVIVPGVNVPLGLPSVEVARELVGVPEDGRMVFGMGRAIYDSGLDIFDEVCGLFEEELPNFVGFVRTVGGARNYESAMEIESDVDPWVAVQAADVVFCPDRRAGFKMTMAMAMALGKPVVARELGSLREIGVADVSAQFFGDDGDAYYQLKEVLAAPVYSASLGSAARARAEDYLGLDRCVSSFARMLKDSAQRR
jgi:glycosyltransferase involved in cell wall biosynthesis